MPQHMTESQLSTEEQVSTIWGLGSLSLLQLWKKVIAGINDDNLLGRASELAYNFILALFCSCWRCLEFSLRGQRHSKPTC